MMGFRGTTRLISTDFEPALRMELEALKKVWDMGFRQFRIMLPFCRLPEDGVFLKEKIRKVGFEDMKIGMMVELASNVLLAKDFSEIFDFFYVGPRDLTQNVYGADRSLPKLAKYDIGTAAPIEAVLTFLNNIRGREKEVFIPFFDLYRHIVAHEEIKGNTTIYYACPPGEILKDFTRIADLENENKTKET